MWSGAVMSGVLYYQEKFAGASFKASRGSRLGFLNVPALTFVHVACLWFMHIPHDGSRSNQVGH